MPFAATENGQKEFADEHSTITQQTLDEKFFFVGEEFWL